MQHQQRRGDRRHRCHRGGEAVAQQSFTANFASAPPVSGKPPRPSAITAAGSSIGHRRRAPAWPDHADGEEQRRPSPARGAPHRRPRASATPPSPATRPMPMTAAMNPIWLTLE